MKILVLNCGSSSVKYKLFDMEQKSVIAQGGVEKVGLEGAFIKFTLPSGEKVVVEKAIPEHKTAIELILSILTSEQYGAIKSLQEIGAVGHRVVHGGEKFNSSVLVTDEVIATIKDCSDMAPLHNPANLLGIETMAAILPGVPQVAVFDTAIEYQNGRANIKSTAINILKGFFACSLIGVVPVELYKLCITLQNTFAHDIASLAGANAAQDIGQLCSDILDAVFDMATGSLGVSLFSLLALIAFAYCVVKVFFQNIKRGGILLIQMTVGALYMFSVPRGYTDGFNQWMKQIAALCLTAFMQTTLLYLGLMTFKTSMLLGLGIMLAANEVPRIAQQFGLDSSVRVNMMSVFHASTTAVNMGRTIVKAFK